MIGRIVIIGGGPAGVEAAMAARQKAKRVSLISDGPIGGRAGWHSLLPSKVWLSAAAANTWTPDSTNPTYWQIDQDLSSRDVVQHISRVKQSWNRGLTAALENREIEIIQGEASFISDNKVKVQTDEDGDFTLITADAFIVASGSVPIFPPHLKPDGKRVIAPRFASQLNELPRSMIVVGAGATGCESAYLFNQFGVEVTWIVDQFGILPRMNQDLGLALGNALSDQGVNVIQGQMVDRLERDNGVTAILDAGKRLQAEMAFVAVGRKPDLGRLNLAEAGLTLDSDGQIRTDRYGRTSNKRIYLVGDAAGGVMVANKATAQARIAGLHAAGVAVNPFNSQYIVQVAYTEPQAAQIGSTRIDEGANSVRIPFSSALKAHLTDPRNGFLELFYSEPERRIIGAVAFGSHAADILTPLVVALHLHATVDQLAEMYAAHPTLSELAFIAARAICRGK